VGLNINLQLVTDPKYREYFDHFRVMVGKWYEEPITYILRTWIPTCCVL